MDNVNALFPPLFSENAMDIIIWSNADGTIRFISPSVRRILGYEPADMIGRRGKDYYHPVDVPVIMNWTIDDSTANTCRIRHRDGHYVWLEMTVTIVRNSQGDIDTVIGIARDVTHRVENENKLLISQEKLKQAQRIARLGNWEWDLREDRLEWSDELYHITGVAFGNIVGIQSYYNLIHAEDIGRVKTSIEAGLTRGEFEYVCRIAMADEGGKFLHVHGIVNNDDNGTPISVFGTAQDITEQVRKDELLEETLERYRSLKRYNPDSVLSLTKEGQYISLNLAAEKLLGYTPAEMSRMSFTEIIAEACRESAWTWFRKIIEQQIIEELSLTLLTKWGDPLDIVATPAPIIIRGDMFGCYLIVKDVTEQRKKDEHLLNTEKLSTAGQLAAAIAHEVRNPLTAIKGFLKLMQSGQFKPDFLQILLEEFNRIELITNELLVLAKPQDVLMKRSDIIAIVDQIIALLESQANMNNVVIVRDIRLESLELSCDENHIKQVLINIMKNALEVMPDGGEMRITVTVGNEQAVIGIKDTGPGIPPEQLAQLGRPFFTTKTKGTGLGLMICNKIIENHGGELRFTSEVKKGTLVEIKLPLESAES